MSRYYSDSALILLYRCRKQTNQTARASGQSRAPPVRSCKEDGGFSFSFSCCSWLSSFSDSRSPGSCSSSLRSAETYRRHGLFVGAFVTVVRTPGRDALLPGRDCGGCSGLPSEAVFRKTRTCPGQREELPALSSAAVCREAEVLHASNHTDLTTHRVGRVQVVSALTHMDEQNQTSLVVQTLQVDNNNKG